MKYYTEVSMTGVESMHCRLYEGSKPYIDGSVMEKPILYDGNKSSIDGSMTSKSIDSDYDAK